MTKMGRPPKSKSEVKSTTLTVRLTSAERKQALEAAKRAGIPLSEWARLAITSASAASKPTTRVVQ
jgi:predicted HicB family RNase H-like nuclease